MGKRLVTRPRGHFFFWGKEPRLSNDCCLRQITWPRIIEIPLKRSCFLLPCISPCLLLHPISGKEDDCIQERAFTYHLLEQNRKEQYLASKSAVHRRYIVPNHNHQPARAIWPLSPKPSPSHNTSHFNTPTLADINSLTTHAERFLLNSGSSIIAQS